MDVIEIRSQKKVEIAPQLGLRPCVPNFSLKRILIFESLSSWKYEVWGGNANRLFNYHFANHVIIAQCKPPLEQLPGKGNWNKTSGPCSSAFTSFCWASSRQGSLAMTPPTFLFLLRLKDGPRGEFLLTDRSVCSSFLHRAPWNMASWSPLLALEVLSPTQCVLPTRHELFATSSPIGLVTLAPIPTWQKCPHCFATCFYHLAFKCGLNRSSIMSGATEMLWFQASNTSFRRQVPKCKWFP